MRTIYHDVRVGQAPKKKSPEHHHTKKSVGVTEPRLFSSESRWKRGGEVFGLGSGQRRVWWKKCGYGSSG